MASASAGSAGSTKNLPQPPPLPAELKRSAEDYAAKGITYAEGSFSNARGIRLSTFSWIPSNGQTKALILLLHGYAVDCGTYFRDTAERLALDGYAVYGLDYEGHGQSEGLRAFVTSLERVVDDCIAYFSPIREKEEYKGKARFMVGESMGGAIVLLMHRREPAAWDGAVLMAPMCKISEKLKPPAVVEAVLKRIAGWFPSLAIVPTADVIDSANHDPDKRKRIRSNPLMYQGKPRLGTAVELLRVSQDIESRLGEVTFPFLLLHGDSDTVTDPEISQALYDAAQSSDKTFKRYPGLWHALTEGEFGENAEVVFKDILAWLDERSSKKA